LTQAVVLYHEGEGQLQPAGRWRDVIP